MFYRYIKSSRLFKSSKWGISSILLGFLIALGNPVYAQDFSQQAVDSLQLSGNQADQVRAIISKYEEKRAALRSTISRDSMDRSSMRAVRNEMRAIDESMRNELSVHLSEEQLQDLDALMGERRKQMRRQFTRH